MADVDIHIDMENTLDGITYLSGAWPTRPGAVRGQDVRAAAARSSAAPPSRPATAPS